LGGNSESGNDVRELDRGRCRRVKSAW
jgi:hypothetical protein